MQVGTPKIKIPLKPDSLTIEAILPYFPRILEKFDSNASKIRANYDKYCLQHDILEKKRPHDDTSVNNKVLEPHLKGMIEWKTGYILGNPIKFAQSKDTQTDDIQYLNKYIRYCNKRSVDKEVLTQVYATGVGYYFIEPKAVEVDTEYEAPFELYCRDADTCSKVYSSYNGNKPLFDFLYTEIDKLDENGTPKTYYIVDLYLPNRFYEFELQDKEQVPTFEQIVQDVERTRYTKLPLVEKRLLNGIGIVETSKLLQDALDNISSNNLDNLQDVANAIFKYKNVNLGDTAEKQKEAHQAVRRNGAVVITQDNPDLDADVTILQPEAINMKDVGALSEYLTNVMYTTVGVPRPTSNTNSGGTTKSGSEIANGYDNAYNRALDDINSYIDGDRQLLENILFICQGLSNNKINNLKASEIDIKYCLNLTDNMLIKSQSAGTFYSINMPKALILEKCKLSNDPEAEGKLWEEQDQEALKRQQEKKVVEDIDVNEPKAQ